MEQSFEDNSVAPLSNVEEHTKYLFHFCAFTKSMFLAFKMQSHLLMFGKF